MQELHYDDVPFDWAVCFQSDCPLAGTCLRHHAATLLPASVYHHNAVCPQARTADGCHLFVADEPVAVAYGITSITQTVNPWDAKRIHDDLSECFGSRAQFYRYSAGRYPIAPQKQAEVAAIYRKYGHEDALGFIQIKQEFYFPTA